MGDEACCWGTRPPGLAELPVSIARAGQPTLTTLFHVFMAEQAAKKGSRDASIRHELAADTTLRDAPNPWLSGLLALHRSCAFYFDGDFTSAFTHARLALKQSDTSGHRRTRSLALANLAATYLALGQIGRANRCIEEATASVQRDEQLHSLFLESRAEITLSNGMIGECRALLDAADAEASALRQVRSEWYNRWTTATRIRLLLCEGRTHDALALAQSAAANLEHDGAPTTQRIKLALVLSLIDAGHLDDGARELTDIMSSVAATSPRVAAQIEFLQAYLENVSTSEHTHTTTRLERALQLQVGWGDGTDLLLATSRYIHISSMPRPVDGASLASVQAPRAQMPPRPIRTYVCLDDLARARPSRPSPPSALTSLLWCAAHGSHSVEVLAEGIVESLVSLQSISRATLLVREPGHASVELLKFGHQWLPAPQGSVAKILVPIEHRHGCVYDLTLWSAASPTAQVECLRLVELVRRLMTTSKPAHHRFAITSPSQDDSTNVFGVFSARIMQELFREARVAGRSRANVLITGESGTGKEVIARAIHGMSDAQAGRFVAFNCAAIPRELVESQLFGYRRGSYTGAVESFPGILRSSDGGTLFLDEIADLPLEIQPKLLRFLDRGEILPIGELSPHTVATRVIAATNADLENLVSSGRFRSDLFYRLAVIHLHVPPLRERRNDIMPLAYHLLEGACRSTGLGAVELSTEVQRALLAHDWPGNVRELANVVNRMVAFAGSTQLITTDMLPARLRQRRDDPPPAINSQMPGYLTVSLDHPLQDTLRKVEQAAIERALLHSHGSTTETAKRLGVSRKGLYLKRRRMEPLP